MSVLFRNPPSEFNPTLGGSGFAGGLRFGTLGFRRLRRDDAMRQSVVWAATHLRADLLSMMPVDVYMKRGGVNIAVPPPPVLVTPDVVADGQPMSIREWMYSTQTELDTMGNVVGIIRSTDAFGLPAQIELVPAEELSIRIKGRKIVEYRINGTPEKAKYIWHERQFTRAGLPIGLSPIAHAALPITASNAAQEWAVSWFENGAVPSSIIRHKEKRIPEDNAAKYKAQYIEKRIAGEPFFVGNDWEYIPIAAKAAESSFIEQMQYTDTDLCRFFGMPAHIVDVAVQSGGQINYANITQANLQLLIVNLGGAKTRREDNLTRLTTSKRFVKLNANAVLQMDAKTRAEVHKLRIDSRTTTPDRVLAIEDEMPFDEADYTQLERLFGARTPNQPQTAGGEQ